MTLKCLTLHNVGHVLSYTESKFHVSSTFYWFDLGTKSQFSKIEIFWESSCCMPPNCHIMTCVFYNLFRTAETHFCHPPPSSPGQPCEHQWLALWRISISIDYCKMRTFCWENFSLISPSKHFRSFNFHYSK